MFSLHKRASWLVLSVIVVLSVSAGARAANVVKIMPLGDSITRGWYGSAYRWGYRRPLYVSLTNGGYNFDFVGGQTDGNFPDPQHEGHDGWQADNILPYLQGWLNTHQPDVVLLHIGTNDVTWNDADANEVNDILNVIDNYEADSNKGVTVVLARIIDRYPNDPNTTTYNNDLNTMATTRIANGDNIIIVNMQYALNYSTDMADWLHPNDNGYAKMANVWYIALADYLNSLSLAISGYVLEAGDNTPVEGVLIRTDDNDINSVTDANGYYELLVNHGWSGVVIPEKEGYVFEPNSNTYNNVTQGYSDVNYTATLITFKISGYVVELDSNTPVEGVLIQTDDNDINSVTDANGYYELLVNYGWSGVAMPQKEGRVFEPNSIAYSDVNHDYTDMNYTAVLMTFKISGFVFEQNSVTPISDVNISANNGGDSTMTDVNGFYEVVVDYNWSGDVTANKYAYGFEPNSRHYEFVDHNFIADQNFTGNEYDFKITGFIKNQCDVPIEGVLIDANNGGGEDTTDVNGFYEVWVPTTWSGTVTPTKQYYTFNPTLMSYVNVLADQRDQNYIADNIYDLDCDGSIGWGDVAVMAESWLGTGFADFDQSGKVDFLDFAKLGWAW